MATKRSKAAKRGSSSRRTRSKKETMKGGTRSRDPLPDRIFAQASPRSIGGVSMLEAQGQIRSETVANFYSEGDVVNAAVGRLQQAGFEILQISPLSINIAGSASQYREAFNTDLVVIDRPVIKEQAKEDVAQFIDSLDTDTPGLIRTRGTKFEDVIEGVALEEPVYYMAASMFAPLKSYWHLRMPGDVSLGCNADRAHRAGITGKGVRVAMVDSGWFKHPYFLGRGYRAAPVVLGPAAANPLADESGHGTGESANIFANAPDVELLPVKINFVNSTGAFNAAAGLTPDIITCSWGSSVAFGPLSAANQTLAAAIAAAVAAGITVVFSAGNGHAGFPGQHPDVISAGGVFMNPDETLQASNYASGFVSNVYPARSVPDVCGLVGMLPKAIYIMLPLEPSDDIDIGNAGGTHPNGDETTSSDGWAAFSGTSAAAPQLAGVAALIKQACPALGPAQIKDTLMKTARDVTTGTCNTVFPLHTGLPAAAGFDTATGSGLVDAHKAVLMAKVKCLGPIIPIVVPVTTPPIVPITGPIVPITGPIVPITGPIVPITGPVVPVFPVKPITPRPIEPIRPIAPIVNPGPMPQSGAAGREAAGAQGGGGGGEAQPSGQLSADDVEALSQMIVKSEIELG